MYTFDSDIVSDLHKDALGSRPGEGFWRHWNESTCGEKQEIWDNLIKAVRARAEEEQMQLDASSRELELRVATLIESGAGDRDVAIRWIVESLELTESDLMYGGEYVCFKLNLPFSYRDEFDRAVNAMERV